ncbi:DMT family transporter [Sphingomicrobium nitratireducens]|uniref:DMT family transporter n=1 Tax=Sphingomicrobium nitratireducens TaxID=2964666 RepID=UPI00223F994B|nr:DMT family transporter [Sphingomicrobium nitratireducens]
MRTRETTLAFMALMIGSAALALGPWLVRIAGVGPVAAGFWRLALAVPMLALVALALGQSLKAPPKKAMLLVAVGSFFFAADLASWHIGIHLTKLGNATLFGNFGSFLFAVYGLVLLRTLPTRAQGLALFLAAFGAVLLLSGSLEISLANLRGDLLALLAGLLYTGYLISIDRVRKTIDALPIIFWASLAGAVWILPMAILSGDRMIPEEWSHVALLAFSSQLVGQGLLVYAIGRLPPLVVGIGLLTQVAIAAAVGWLVYGEAFAPLDWVGAIAIGVALVLIRLRPRPIATT